jgi:hypothetical protein
MATILPTTPIEMPDLAGQAFKLQEYRAGQKAEAAKEAREQQDRRGASIGLDRAYAQGGEVGRLMPPYIPETQKAFQEFIKAGEQYKYSGLESDKQAFLESQNNFNALFGSSLEKSTSDRAEIAGFAKKPSEYAVSGDEFNQITQGYLNTSFNKEQILNPMERFILPVAEQIEFLQPNEMANAASGVILGSMVNDFSPDGVALNKPKAIEWAEKQWLPSILADPDFYLKAVIYGARKTDWGRLGTKELSNYDLERLRALPQQEKEALVNVFRKDTMNDLIQIIPNSVGEYKQEKTERSDEVKRYENLKPADTGVQVGKLVIGKGTKEKPNGTRTFTPTEKSKTVPMYELPSDAWITTRNHTIVGFGKTTEKINGIDANIPYIRTIRKDEKKGIEVREVRRATLEDLSVLKNKMKDTYYDYFDN